MRKIKKELLEGKKKKLKESHLQGFADNIALNLIEAWADEGQDRDYIVQEFSELIDEIRMEVLKKGFDDLAEVIKDIQDGKETI